MISNPDFSISSLETEWFNLAEKVCEFPTQSSKRKISVGARGEVEDDVQ